MKRFLAFTMVLLFLALVCSCAAEPTTVPIPTEPAKEETKTDVTGQPQTSVEEPAQVYNICLILPMSGPYANTGASMYAGVLCAYEYFLEEEGGFAGKNIDVQFTLCDLENDADLAASLFEKNAGTMDAAMGCFKTAATIACASLAIKYEIPFINIMSSADTVSGQENDYVFKMCASDTQAMSSIMGMMVFLEGMDDHAYNAGSIIATTDDYAQSMSGSLKNLIFPELGWEVATEQTLQVGQTTDASGAINKAKQSGSDLTCVIVPASEAVLIQKQFREYRFDQPVWAGGAGYFDVSYFENTAGAGDYVVSLCTWERCKMQNFNALTEKWFNRVVEVSGISFNESGACAWLGCGVLLQAIQNADSLSKQDVAAAISALKLPKEHWSNMFIQFGGVSFGQMEGLVGIPVLYNVNEYGCSIGVQSINSQWELVYLPGETVANNPCVWPHIPYSEGNTYQG